MGAEREEKRREVTGRGEEGRRQRGRGQREDEELGEGEIRHWKGRGRRYVERRDD